MCIHASLFGHRFPEVARVFLASGSLGGHPMPQGPPCMATLKAQLTSGLRLHRLGHANWKQPPKQEH